MKRSLSQGARTRPGVVLLVVITLLTLFAVVGVTFVIFAQAEASSARVWREGETFQRPDMDVEMLLSHVMGQVVFPVPDDQTGVYSVLRGQEVARSMYGYNTDVGASNTVPFNGVGRLRYQVPCGVLGNQENFNLINHQHFGADGFLRDPERYGTRANLAAPPGPWAGGFNVSYTYPDMNNPFLASVRASDGAVLIQSYHRGAWTGFGSLDPSNPNWTAADPSLKYKVLRPRPADHAGFPPPEDAGGDVKQLANSPGYLIPGTNPPQFANNDSFWMYTGFPVMKAPDGRKFTALFAILMQDLDNRVNVNVVGNVRGSTTGAGGGLDPLNGLSLSDQGLGHWEVNPQRVLTAMEGANYEARRLFIGNNGVKGRYDLNFWGFDWHRLPAQYGIRGPFYSNSNFDANYPNMGVFLPGNGAATATSCFPAYSGNYDGAGYGNACRNHPLLYNFFMPEQNYYYPGPADRAFSISTMEALLRYGDRGSPALRSDLFLCCPLSLADAKTRRLVTTHAIDVDRPGVAPWIWDPTAQPYQLNAGSLTPSGGTIATTAANSPLPAPPAGSEFAPDWRALTAALGRINLNRTLANYPAPDATNRITDAAGFKTAQDARQQLAKEIYDCFRKVTGAADPAVATKDAPDYNACRWLAQLAVNIVDYTDTDDYMTPFNWTGDEWVYGTELPRVVLNETYAEVINDPNDLLNAGKATMPYKVKFWVELHNPLFPGNGVGGQGGAVPLTEDGKARLQVAASGASPAYAVYQVVVAQTPNPDIRKANNVLGDADPAKVKIVMSDFSPDAAFTPTVDVNVIQPSSGATSGPNGSNQGFYLLGPKGDFPGTDAARPQSTLHVKDQMIGGKQSSMVYDLPVATDLTQPPPKHTVLLKRLACPYRSPQTDPTQPDYNPYITVDYMEEVATSDGVNNDSVGVHVPTPVDQRTSVGRQQPYAADKSQQKVQAPMAALMNQPQHTMFNVNAPKTSPFDWLNFADRQLISPMELLQVSGFKPHELTQQFVTVDGAGVTQKFTHRAPWFDASARIFRALEFFNGGCQVQWMPTGGRTVGKININTVQDIETFMALCDPVGNNFYTSTDVQNIFQRMLAQRTPNGSPGPNDRPFRGLAAPYAAAGDPQYPAGIGIDDTFLAADTSDPNPNPALKRRLFEPAALPASANGHPYMKYELMKKVYNSMTTRSNIFAVWVTVGFFEVVDDSDPTRMPKLGREIGRAENRHVRHRMFAIVDRSNLSVDPNNPGQAGPRPFFIPSQTAVTTAGAATINVPGVSGTYEGMSWSINTGDQIVVDVGQNQETVAVTVGGAPPTISATFAKPHAQGFSLSKAILGNPGPQRQFDVRNPAYSGIVRYFSIIE